MGFIPRSFSTLPSSPAFPLLLLVVLPLRSSACRSISSLSSVVEDGSPGSSLLMPGASTLKPLLLELTLMVVAAAAARVRGRLFGGASLESTELADFLCLEVRDGDPAASSPEASRDEGCSRSMFEDLRRSEGIWLVRFLLAEEPVEEGDDMGMDVPLRCERGERSDRYHHCCEL